MWADSCKLPAESPGGPKHSSLLIKLNQIKSWETVNFKKNCQLLDRLGKGVRTSFFLVVYDSLKYQEGLRTPNWRMANFFPVSTF